MERICLNGKYYFLNLIIIGEFNLEEPYISLFFRAWPFFTQVIWVGFNYSPNLSILLLPTVFLYNILSTSTYLQDS